jgi:(1->4)-alpha-D-glucan 1-alpha-D-glucosylmutase
LQLLAHRLNRISEHHRRSRDFTLHTLRVALREILACFPIYRTYIRPDFVGERDRQVLCRAAAQAKRRNPAISADVFDFVRDVLLLERPPELDEAGRHERYLFVGRVQQVTSPVLAKGIEDTAFYRYFPLASLNEVGGDPRHGAVAVEQFHRHNRVGQLAWPRSLVCTTTHDTKRSEDVRARISVLSEIPHFWRHAVNRWARLNRRHHRQVDGQLAPSRNDEFFFYQTLIGVWPLTAPTGDELRVLCDRVTAYMQKATHESKVHTSWINPDAEYDTAVREFVAAVLDGGPKNRFLGEFCRFHEQILPWGLYSALSQTLLKLTAPGVPDIYQGQELWDFSLVDPDNRRPVDYTLRRRLLTGLRKEAGRDDRTLLPLAKQLAVNPRDPRSKLFVTWRALQFRRQAEALFQHGDYLPLEAIGVRARHVCAFARQISATSRGGPRVAIVVAPRLFAQLVPLSADAQPGPPPLGPTIWEDTSVVLGSLATSTLENVFTGHRFTPRDGLLPLAEVLADFPVAVLSSVRTS